MNDTPNRRKDDARPAVALQWGERPDQWTLLLTGPTAGVIGPLGSTWPNHPAELERVDVCVRRKDGPAVVYRTGGEGATTWHQFYPCTSAEPLRDGEYLFREGATLKPEFTHLMMLAAERAGVSFSAQQKCWRAWFDTREPRQPPKLDDSEQYRLQMAAIGTASFGYWKEGDSIHQDYDTVPLRDVARLYAKYEALHKAQPSDAARDILAERRRQVEQEGYAPQHDDEHVGGEIAAYAAFYAMPPAARDWPATETGYGETFGEAIVPADWKVPKEGDRRAELVKAGALILAEIERLDRAAEKSGTLTAEEQAFVELVRQRPGHKLNSGEARGTDGASLWERPQALGLIEAVGSYKWVVPGAQAQNPVGDAVDAALVDAIKHGTGAFTVKADGSTEHVELRQVADMVRPDVTAADFAQPGVELTEEQRRYYAELAAFPPKLQRDALYQDYAVPVKPADDGGKPE